MNRNLETGQLYDFLKSLEEKSDFDKAFEEAGFMDEDYPLVSADYFIELYHKLNTSNEKSN